MSIGCDHLLSGRGRRDCALLRYLVLLNQLSVCASCLSAVRGRPLELYARHVAISRVDAVDFSGKSSDGFTDHGVHQERLDRGGTGRARGTGRSRRQREVTAPRAAAGKGASGQPLVFAKPAEGSRAGNRRQNTGRARNDPIRCPVMDISVRAIRSAGQRN